MDALRWTLCSRDATADCAHEPHAGQSKVINLAGAYPATIISTDFGHFMSALKGVEHRRFGRLCARLWMRSVTEGRLGIPKAVLVIGLSVGD